MAVPFLKVEVRLKDSSSEKAQFHTQSPMPDPELSFTEKSAIYRNRMVFIVDDFSVVQSSKDFVAQFFYFVTSNDITILKWLKWIPWVKVLNMPLLDMKNFCKVSRSTITFWKRLSGLFLLKQLSLEKKAQSHCFPYSKRKLCRRREGHMV